MPDGSYSVSDVADCIEYIIKKHKTLTKIPPIYVYINRINNRLMFKTKDGYKLEFQTPEAKKLFGRTKKLIDKTKMEKYVLSLKEVEVVLIQYKLVDNRYQQKIEVYTLLHQIDFMLIC